MQTGAPFKQKLNSGASTLEADLRSMVKTHYWGNALIDVHGPFAFRNMGGSALASILTGPADQPNSKVVSPMIAAS